MCERQDRGDILRARVSCNNIGKKINFILRPFRSIIALLNKNKLSPDRPKDLINSLSVVVDESECFCQEIC